MLLDRLKKLFQRKELPRDAKDLINNSKNVNDLLQGLDSLITQNEVEVDKINEEIAALEEVESREMGRVRSGELPDRSKNNVLRRIQRLRKQMDNLEERQRIYNRNINLQIDLVGRVQALDAMELRGVDEDKIDDILADYEDELTRYQGVMDSENLSVGDLDRILDDTQDLAALEAEVMGSPNSMPTEPEAPRAARNEKAGVDRTRAETKSPAKANSTEAPSADTTKDRKPPQQAPAQGEAG